MTMFLLRLAGAGLLLLGPAAAAEFPTKPIQLIVPFSAGGGTDLTARILGEALERQFDGATVVVVNRPGAGGEIGMAELAEAAPDGYTLGILNTPNMLSIPIERDAGFALDSFDLIGVVADDPGTLSVLEDSPIESVADLVAMAKEEPGSVSFGSAGVGSAGHIAMLLLQQAAGFEGQNVPFQGSSAVRTALLTGEIDVATANLGEAQSFAEGQPWRILGVMAAERSDQAPDLPTFAEQGYPVETGSARGIGAPRGVPPEILAALEEAVAAAVEDPEFIAAAEQAAVPVRYLDATQFTELLAATDQQLRDLWAASPWQQ